MRSFQLSVADLWPLLLGFLAVLATRGSRFDARAIGIRFSFVIPIGQFIFFAGVV